MKIYDRIQAIDPRQLEPITLVKLWVHRSGLPFIYLRREHHRCRVMVSGQELEQGFVSHLEVYPGVWVAASRAAFEKWSKQ